MPEKERQKAIDKVNTKYQKKWDELNKLYMNAKSTDEQFKISLEMDSIDAAWSQEIDDLKRS